MRRLLERVGIGPGHWILHAGSPLTGHGFPRLEELRECEVYWSSSEDGAAGPPGGVFDAVVALDCAPGAPSAAPRGWRRVLAPEGGAVIVTGTDIAMADGEGRPASRQWAAELESAGFAIESVGRCPVEPERYGALARTAHLVRDSLSDTLGAGAAGSYLSQIRRLEDAVRKEAAHRFEIIARPHGVT